MKSRPSFRAGPARAAAFALALLCNAALSAPQAPGHNALASALAANAKLAQAPHLADEAFTRRSRLSQVKLSPDGKWLAFLETEGSDTWLQVRSVDSGAKRTLLKLAGRNALHWSNDASTIFVDSGNGLAAVSVADGASSKIAAFDRKLEQQFLQVDPSQPRHALTESFDREAKLYRISRVGTDGAITSVYEGEQAVKNFLLDASGKPGFIRTLDKNFDSIVYRQQNGKWVETRRCRRLRACQLVAASADGRVLTMIVNHANDRKALVRLDIGSGKERVLHTDPTGVADLREAVQSRDRGEPLFAVYDLPHRRNYGLTEKARRVAGQLVRRFPDSNITIAAAGDKGPWLLTERGARLQQERYWLFDVASGRTAPVLTEERDLGKPLAEAQLAGKIALRYRASDGAMVHGYLSLPPGQAAARLPMVTMAHGGPWGRFDNDYTPIVQLLVNRGYAVFQPNFRASTGYGDKYMTAPGSDFGNGRVQADIIDGVRWLQASGVGDRTRQAIMGDSFGGYATLLALANTPEMFKFGMATVPPTDFVRTMKAAAAGPAMGDEAPFSLTLKEMGIDLGDAAAMQRISNAAPGANAAKVVRPLLILAGGKDQMVDVGSVTDYVATLQGQGKPVTLLLDPDEGHNPRKPLVRQAYTYLLQRMLQEHLGGPAVAAPSPELAKYLEQTVKINGALESL